MVARGTLWYRAVRSFVRNFFFKPLSGFRILHAERVPLEGMLIIAPNHMSHLDPPAVACAMPRAICFMAKEELFRNKLFGKLIGSLSAFPIRRGEGDSGAIRMAIDLLSKGNAVLVFPEGSRGDGVQLSPLNRGVAMLAKRSGAPVLPVGIGGTQFCMPKGASKPKRGRITLSFGTPIVYGAIEASDEKERRELFTKLLEEKILELCAETGFELKASATKSDQSSCGPRD